MDWQTDVIALVVLGVVVLLYRHWTHSFKPGKEHPSLYRAYARSGGRDPTTIAPTEIGTDSSTYEHPRHGLGYILHNRRYLITD
jgi:hypothetical protein